MNAVAITIPERCITFSHERASWLCSFRGAWVCISAEGARRLIDLGWSLLDDIGSAA